MAWTSVEGSIAQGENVRSYPANRPYYAWSRLAMLGVGLGVFLLFNVASRMPGLVETFYASWPGPISVWLLSRLTGIAPFSVAEFVGLAYITWIVVLTVRTVKQVAARNRQVINALLGSLLRAGRDVGVVLVLFYPLWGLNYARAPLVSRLGWSPADSVALDELLVLASEAVNASNEMYLAMHGTQDTGEPTPRPDDSSELQAALDLGWRRVVDVLDLPPSVGWAFGRTKSLLASPIFARLGVTGFYFPFTAESNARRDLPGISLPATLAHEKAHQRGIAPESEANFLGYIVATLAPHPQAQYSAQMFAQRQLVSAVAGASPDHAQELISRRLPGVQRDLEDMYEYFRQFQGPIADASRAVNDRFLRTNRVEGGVLSYRGSIGLLIAYSRENAGSIIPPGD